MEDATELTETLAALLAGTAGVLDAYLFGSVAVGDDGPDSDVDVAVFLDPDLGERQRAYLILDVATALVAALGRDDVDLVVLNDAPPFLYYRVLRDGMRLVARDPRATAVREGRARSRWYDWRYVQERSDAVRQRHRRLRAETP